MKRELWNSAGKTEVKNQNEDLAVSMWRSMQNQSCAKTIAQKKGLPHSWIDNCLKRGRRRPVTQAYAVPLVQWDIPVSSNLLQMCAPLSSVHPVQVSWEFTLPQILVTTCFYTNSNPVPLALLPSTWRQRRRRQRSTLCSTMNMLSLIMVTGNMLLTAIRISLMVCSNVL